MQLYEFQAKDVFREYGIPIPNGRFALTAEEAVKAAHEIGVPVALKAQVLIGGRGLAGAIRFCSNVNDVLTAASNVLNTRVYGEKPRGLLVEQKFEPVRELYAAVTWDYQRKCPVLIGSSRGGVDVETIAKQRPDDISRVYIEESRGFSEYQGRMLAASIGLAGGAVLSYSNVLNILWHIFEKHDAELIESNPLAMLKDGTLMALDAKLTIDDRSIYRQSNLIDRIKKIANEPSEGYAQRHARAKQLGIPTYVEMDGNIGVISDGAGSGMLTLDLIAETGGKTRIYCEMGGEITPELMAKTITVCLGLNDVKVLLISLIGGSNRMDEMASGIVTYLASHRSTTPLLVRMSGTKQEEGRKILVDHGLNCFDNIYLAVEEAVRLSGDE